MKTTTFLQTDYTLLGSTSISMLNKSILARALSFQINNLKYYESSASMAKTFGVGKDAITNQLKALKKLPFVTFNTISNFENKGRTRFIIIDEKVLAKYLKDEAKVNEAKEDKPKNKPKKSPKSSSTKKGVVESDTQTPIKEVETPTQTPIKVEVKDYSIDDMVNLYQLLPTLDYSPKEIMYLVDIFDTSNVTIRTLISTIGKLMKEQKYNDYTGPVFDKDRIHNIKQIYN